MSRKLDEQTIALAGLFQAVHLVEKVATRGMVAQNTLEASLASLFITHPKCVEDIYGGPEQLPYNLGTGLRIMRTTTQRGARDKVNHTVRYALALLHLEKNLRRRDDLKGAISQGIDRIAHQARYFGAEDEPFANPSAFTHPSIIANTASLYQDTISTFRFRVQVTGNQKLLQSTENADKIRALLLAGIRSAILWHQVGGRRWHLLFLGSRCNDSIDRILGDKH